MNVYLMGCDGRGGRHWSCCAAVHAAGRRPCFNCRPGRLPAGEWIIAKQRLHCVGLLLLCSLLLSLLPLCLLMCLLFWQLGAVLCITHITLPLLLPLQEYFTRIMKKLKQVGATADRTNFYV